jgi:hypothetical protein
LLKFIKEFIEMKLSFAEMKMKDNFYKFKWKIDWIKMIDKIYLVIDCKTWEYKKSHKYIQNICQKYEYTQFYLEVSIVERYCKNGI